MLGIGKLKEKNINCILKECKRYSNRAIHTVYETCLRDLLQVRTSL